MQAKILTLTQIRQKELEMVNIKKSQGVTLQEMVESGLYNIEGFEMMKYYGGNE